MIYFVIWYLIMAGITGTAIQKEIGRDRQLARNVRAVLDLGYPRWLIVASGMLGWPYSLWRLRKGFPEDTRED